MSAYQTVDVLAVDGDTATVRVREIHPDAPAVHRLFVKPSRALVEDGGGREVFGAWLLRDRLDSVIATSSLGETTDWARDLIREISAEECTEIDHSDTHNVPMYEATLRIRVQDPSWLTPLRAGGHLGGYASPHQGWAASQFMASPPPAPSPLEMTQAQVARCARNTLRLLEREGFIDDAGGFVEPSEFVFRYFDPRDPEHLSHEHLAILAPAGGPSSIEYQRRAPPGAPQTLIRLAKPKPLAQAKLEVVCAEGLKGFATSKSKKPPAGGVLRSKSFPTMTDAIEALRTLDEAVSA